MDENVIREMVRRKLSDHRLPQGRAVAFRETAGDGRSCDACDKPIERKQTAISATVSLKWMSVRLHVDCYKMWDQERLALCEKGRADGA